MVDPLRRPRRPRWGACWWPPPSAESCAVSLGDDDARLLEPALRAEFPERARSSARRDRGLGGGDRGLDSTGGGTLASVPVDLRGTAFQQRVWRALARDPRAASTALVRARSPRAIGRPDAARAVARRLRDAIAWPLLVPCHRVVRGGGEPGGYRWGVDAQARAPRRRGRSAQALRSSYRRGAADSGTSRSSFFAASSRAATSSQLTTFQTALKNVGLLVLVLEVVGVLPGVDHEERHRALARFDWWS